MCYDSDEAAAFSVSSLSNRSSPLSWRQGQASPRLQAGDAPSTGNAHSEVPLRISHTSRIQLIESLDDSDPTLLKGDYLSDSDLGGKSPNEDDEEDDDIDDLGNGWVIFFFFWKAHGKLYKYQKVSPLRPFGKRNKKTGHINGLSIFCEVNPATCQLLQS